MPVNELNLTDSWHMLQPGRAGMTWTGRGLESCIDSVYLSPNLADALQSIWVLPTALSDHKLVITHLRGDDIAPRAKGCWHLNTRLLEQEHILREVAQAMRRTLSPSP